MLLQTLHIALQYLKTTYRSRSALIFSLIMPLVFTGVLGVTIGGGSQGGEPSRWDVALVNEDGGVLAASLVSTLQASPQLAVSLLPRSEALARTETGDFVAAVVIPSGLSQALQDGKSPTVQFTANGSQLRPAQSAEQAVRAATSELASTVAAARTSVAVAEKLGLFDRGADQAAYFSDALARVAAQWTPARPITVQAEPVTRLDSADQIAGGFEQSSPGMLVTFALVSILNGAIVLIIEREQGTLRRLLVMPMRKGGILAGKLLAIFAAGLIQAAILILVGQLAFGVNWGQAPLALVLLLLAFSFSVTSLGMLIAGVARTYAQANALANILMYSIAALGGAWWPIEITPAWMQRLAQVTPTYWAMQGFSDIITRGLGVGAILPELAALVGFGVAFMAVGVWRFRYE